MRANHPPPLPINALAACVAGTALAFASPWAPAGPGSPGATQRVAGEAQFADLEQAFWFCDYIATTQGVQAAPVAACKEATEELKKQKFGGDFQRFLEWWRTNKGAEHGRLDRQLDDDAPAAEGALRT